MKPRVVVVGSHPLADQPSMHLFARWLASSLEEHWSVYPVAPRSIALNRFSVRSQARKWLLYVDQYLIFPVFLALWSFPADAVLLADHSTTPAAWLVPSRKLAVMVHDTIAIQHARRGSSFGRWKTSIAGKLLQHLVCRGLKRSRLLLTNPSPVPQELAELNVSAPVVVVGCPCDDGRLIENVAPISAAQYVLHVGSDHPRKRKQELLRLWANVQNTRRGLHLVLVGSTSPDTVALRDRLGLHSVQILGSVPDKELAGLYSGASAVIVASSHEGFCLPVVEALHAGCTVITPEDVTFFFEVFGHAVRPVLRFGAGGATALLDAIDRIQTPPEVEARTRVLETYSKDAFDLRVRSAMSLTFLAGNS